MLKHGEVRLSDQAIVEGGKNWSTLAEVMGIELPPPTLPQQRLDDEVSPSAARETQQIAESKTQKGRISQPEHASERSFRLADPVQTNVKQGALIGGWVCLGLGLFFLISSGWLFLLYLPFFLASFVLSIVAMAQRRILGGVGLLLATLFLPPIAAVGAASAKDGYAEARQFKRGSADASGATHITGTVYVSTAGHGSYRLALAPILALSEQQMQEVKDGYRSAVASQISELESQAERARQQLPLLEDETATARASLAVLVDRKREIVSSVDTPSRVDESRNPFDSTLTAGELRFQQMEEDLQQALQEKERAYGGAKNTMTSSLNQTVPLKDPTRGAPDWLRDEFIALVLANGTELSRTDADGNFDINLPEDARYLVCLSQRQAIGNLESYLWVVDVSEAPTLVEKRKVDFNNLNLTQLTIGLQDL